MTLLTACSSLIMAGCTSTTPGAAPARAVPVAGLLEDGVQAVRTGRIGPFVADPAVAIERTPGQSGDPGKPHYRDLAPLWAAGSYFPLLYSRQAVESNVTERLQLQPGR